MDNVLRRRKHNEFTWDSIGDIEQGRGDLGVDMPVLVYRLMQFTLLDVLTREFGLERANNFFRDAGFLAGRSYAENVLDLTVNLDTFIQNLHESLKELKVGILRIESLNRESGEMTMTVADDLDCSGLEITQENVCIYDEGFIAGILKAYSGVDYTVREVDCWASGDRVCRFHASPA